MPDQLSTRTPPRVVFDCQVFVQALLGTGPSFACLELAEAGVITLHSSAQIVHELSEVLRRPFIREKRPDILAQQIDAFLRRIEACSIAVDPVPNTFTYDRDPKDEPYLNLSISIHAHYLVSRDRDLLDLMDRTSSEASLLQQLCPDLAILEPVGFLRRIESHLSEM